MRRFLVLGAFAVWIGCVAIRWTMNPPFGHDEARYALAARDALAGEPARWSYVPVGMDLVAAPGLLAGGSLRALRVVPALLGLAFLVTAWRAAAAITCEDAAAWAVAVLAGTTPVTRFQVDLLSDQPAAACLLAAIALVVTELRRRPRWRIVAAGPLAAAGLYVRYGSCLAIAIIAIATVAFGRRKLLCPPVIITALAFAALMRPSLLHTLLVSSTVPPQGGGLVEYAMHPIAFAGLLATPLVVLAVVGAWRDRWWLYATLIGIADVVALGLQTRAQCRYIVLGVVLLVTAGCAVARDAGAQIAGPVRRALAGLCLMAVVGAWLAAIAAAWGACDRRIARMKVTLAAAEAIAHDVRGRQCEVIADHAVLLEWYSGCRAVTQRGPRTYLVRDATGGPGQPTLEPGALVLHAPNVDVIRVSAPASGGRAGPSTPRGRSRARR
jgi:hypothetical protein